MLHRLKTIVIPLAAFVAALALPAAAGANPAYEPNDGIHQAFGPLQAGTNYDAVISSSNDVDWYIVYVSGQGVLDVALTDLVDPNESCCGVTARLYDRDGTSLNSTSPDENEIGHISYTTPGAGHYYIEVSGGSNDNYRLSLTGPIVDGPRPGPVDETTPNNNPDISTAFGPLLGGRLYGGRIDASGEEDWFLFYTAGPGTFDVSLTDIVDPNESCCGVTMYLLDRDGNQLSSTSPNEDEIGHLTYTTAGADRFFLYVRGGTNDNYQFRIDPAGLISQSEPAAVSQPCTQTQAKLDKLKQKLAAAKAAKQSAFTKRDRKKAAKKVKKLKGKVKNAKAQVAQLC